MRNVQFQKFVFAGTSKITHRFPIAGAKFLDATFQTIITNRMLSAAMNRKSKNAVGRVKRFKRFLILPDSLIGDSIMMQSSISAIRDFFPDAQIDYIANRTAYPLVEKNPDVNEVIPLFQGKLGMSDQDLSFFGKVN